LSALWKEKSLMISASCRTAQKTGKPGNFAENKEKSVFPNLYPKGYPQIPWKRFTLNIVAVHCSA